MIRIQRVYSGLAKKFFFPNALDTAQELISHPQVDLVTIATPPSTHEELVLAALAAGKYVVCEKPLAHNLASAKKIAKLRTAIKSRSVISSVFTQSSNACGLPVPSGRWASNQDQLSPCYSVNRTAITHGWWGKWNVAGGGTVMTQFVHHLDFFCTVWGQPQWVEARASCNTPGLESEDTCEMKTRLRQWSRSRRFCSIIGDSSANHFEVEGDFGRLSVPWERSQIKPSHLHVLQAALIHSPIHYVPTPSKPVRIVRKILRKEELSTGIRQRLSEATRHTTARYSKPFETLRLYRSALPPHWCHRLLWQHL